MGISFVYEPIVNGVWGFGHGKACDEKGRFVGHLPGLTDDDETLDPSDQRFANGDNLWDQVSSSDYSGPLANGYEPDYSGGYVSRYAELTDEERALAEELWLDPWDTSREVLTRLWCERKYPEYFPTEDVTHESISAEEAAIYSFCMDNWEFFHPELLDDEEVSTAASSQSNEQHDDYLKKLGWYAERSDRGWRQAHGKHGRQNSTERQKKREANRTIRKTFRTVDGRQQIAAEND